MIARGLAHLFTVFLLIKNGMIDIDQADSVRRDIDGAEGLRV